MESAPAFNVKRSSPMVGIFGVVACIVLAPAAALAQDDLKWVDIRSLSIEGQGWSETEHPFARLPSSAKGVVRDAVWSLSQHSAGICARFVTDANAIHAKWSLTSTRLAMSHMTATGVSGLDLYVRGDGGQWRWLGSGQPKLQTNTAKLTSGIPGGSREYMLYLPLYNGVTDVQIGVAADSELIAAPARPKGSRRPVVFYGTSITQGGCASRPGMVHTAMLGRWLDRPVINLGFSGNGTMEKEVVQFMSEIDAAVFVIDCLPNMTAAQVTERTATLVKDLRKKHPDTPILLVEDRDYSDAFLVTSKRRRNLASQKALRSAFESLQADKVNGLYYLEGKSLLGDDNEGTVDSSHPTDLGFWRQAKVFQSALEPLLRPSAATSQP